MSYARRTFLALSLAALLPACATASAPAADNDGLAPALFVARDADSTLYLYGSLHLRRAGEPWGAPHVDAALAQSQEIWSELEISPASEARGQALAMQRGMNAERPLSSWLEPADQARLAALCERLGVPAPALERMRPWLASVTLAVVPMMRAGFDPQAGVDRAIVAWGAANGRTLRAFETPDQQIEMFAGLGDDAQRAMLLDAIANAEQSAERAAAFTTAWEDGDLAAQEQLSVAEVQQQYPALYQVIYAQRNRAWVETLAHELDGAGVDFVVVGAGHLLGEDGLVAQLRARGVRVERVRNTPAS